MTCSCGASFQSDSEDEATLPLMWGQRFATAHQDCGFMSKIQEEIVEKTKRYDITHKEQRENEL